VEVVELQELRWVTIAADGASPDAARHALAGPVAGGHLVMDLRAVPRLAAALRCCVLAADLARARGVRFTALVPPAGLRVLSSCGPRVPAVVDPGELLFGDAPVVPEDARTIRRAAALQRELADAHAVRAAMALGRARAQVARARDLTAEARALAWAWETRRGEGAVAPWGAGGPARGGGGAAASAPGSPD
jgi:hypothetical protein